MILDPLKITPHHADGLQINLTNTSIGYYFAKSGQLDPKYHKMLINARKIREIADYDTQEEIVDMVRSDLESH